MSPRLGATLAAVAFVAVAALSTWRAADQFDRPGDAGSPGFQDFFINGYFPALALGEGVNPYDPVAFRARFATIDVFPLYSPAVLTLYRPLTLLPPRAAAYVHHALSVALLPLLAAACLRICRLRADVTRTLLLATFLMLGRPGHQALLLGHSTVWLVLAIYLALAAPRRLAALGLGIATVKPTFGLPLAALLLCGGQVRTVTLGGALGVALALVPLPALLQAAGGPGAFLRSLAANVVAFGRLAVVDPASSTYRVVDLPALLARLVGRPLGLAVDATLAVALVALAGIAVHRLARAGDPARRLLASCVVCVTILVATYHQVYDALVLTLPLVACGSGACQGFRRPAARVTAVVLLLAPFTLAYLASPLAIDRLMLGLRGALLVCSLTAAAVAGAYVALLAQAWVATAPARAVRPCAASVSDRHR